MTLRSSLAAGLAALLLLVTSCNEKEERHSAPPATDAGLAPLVAPASALMPVPGYANAVLVSPVGATRPMPLVVAVLGIGDTPESQCATWRELVGQRAFIVCPRFTPHFVPVEAPGSAAGPSLLSIFGLQGDEAAEADPSKGEVVQSGFRPTDVPQVEREIAAAIAAVKKTFPKHVAPGPALYVGFSRGAFLGASLVAKNPSTFPRAILIEGGQSAWTDATAAAFVKGGGKRVLFACGQPSCVAEAEPASQLLTRAAGATRIVHGEGEGHGYKRQVKDQIRLSLDWVTEGDPAWRQLLAR
ncbi:MAG: hypothetical protein JST00_00230 [Deltaproteobacteria bacterium]|nr:hypothetical protein [Deltaproteobacteria bacterium]